MSMFLCFVVSVFWDRCFVLLVLLVMIFGICYLLVMWLSIFWWMDSGLLMRFCLLMCSMLKN